MGQNKYGPETCHEERVKRRLQVIYARKTRERRIFMDELKVLRKRREKYLMKCIKTAVGPKWYQALSVPQRIALDKLEFSIYQDLLEGRPIRTAIVMRELGLFPRPHTVDLMNCLYLCNHDPKEMLAQLYLATYGYPIEGKCASYSLNARLVLSAILYLGLDNLIHLLRERFRPDPQDKKPIAKPKSTNKPPDKSPYLQKMVAFLYEKPKRKRNRPPPLPNLDDLNEPYEDEPVIPKPPPPPPPPPPPKRRLPRSYCDQIAGVVRIEPYSVPIQGVPAKPGRLTARKLRGSKMSLTEGKKTYGMGSATKKKSTRRRKPVAPHLNTGNAQYTINGVYSIGGKTVYVLGNVSILPAEGDLIHGGFKYMGGECINIHCGFRERPPPPKPDRCDCVKVWQDKVFNYLKNNKCRCGHHFDYGNEGTFLPDELPFFTKPTRHTPMQFNYHTIFDLDPKRLHVEKEFKALWDTDSVLHVDDGTNKDKKDKKKKKKRDSTTCLGQNPQPEDYLKCALRLMRRVNVAARLPDLHLVPELKEWMRRRIHGPFTAVEKSELLRRSGMFWQIFQMLANRGFGHVSPFRDPTFAGETTWSEKQDLNEKFKRFSFKYKLETYRSYAYINNLFWPSMCQAETPDKKFREIYFSYLFGRMEDLQLMHPYSSREALERKFAIAKKRYICPPAGIEPKT